LAGAFFVFVPIFNVVRWRDVGGPPRKAVAKMRGRDPRGKRRGLLAFDRRSPPFAKTRGAKDGAPSSSFEQRHCGRTQKHSQGWLCHTMAIQEDHAPQVHLVICVVDVRGGGGRRGLGVWRSRAGRRGCWWRGGRSGRSGGGVTMAVEWIRGVA
jgi:hypothetical protein